MTANISCIIIIHHIICTCLKQIMFTSVLRKQKKKHRSDDMISINMISFLLKKTSYILPSSAQVFRRFTTSSASSHRAHRQGSNLSRFSARGSGMAPVKLGQFWTHCFHVLDPKSPSFIPKTVEITFLYGVLLRFITKIERFQHVSIRIARDFFYENHIGSARGKRLSRPKRLSADIALHYPKLTHVSRLFSNFNML